MTTLYLPELEQKAVYLLLYERQFYKCFYSWINLEPQWSNELLHFFLFFIFFYIFFTFMPPFSEAWFTYDRNAPIDIRKGYTGFGLSAADCEGISTSGICWATSQMCGTKHHWKHYDRPRKPTVLAECCTENNLLLNISTTKQLIVDFKIKKAKTHSVVYISGAGEQLGILWNYHHREPIMAIKHHHPG